MKRTGRILLALGLIAGLSACSSSEKDSTASTDEPKSNTRNTALASNQAPVIDSVHLEPTNPRPGERITALVAATDPDGDPLEIEYRWRVDGKAVENAGRSLHVEHTSKGAVIELTVVVSDRIDQSQPERLTTRVGNLAPRVLQVIIEPLGEVTAGRDIAARPRATDPDGDAITFRYRWTVNGNLVGGEHAALSSEHYKRGDKIELEVVATDGIDESEPLRSAEIPVVNSAPRIVSEPGQLSDSGVFSYQLQVEDADRDITFRYRLLNGPEGMDVDVVDGQVSWTPRPDQSGSHKVELEVEDMRGGRATQSFDVTISFEALEEEEAPAAPAP